MSINKVILLGLLGNNPEKGKTQNGKEFANFSLATSKKWKDQNGEKKEQTAWHNITCWGKIVNVCEYLEKGSKIYVEGELEYQKYIDKNGVEKIATKILANTIDIIKGKNSGNGNVDSHNEAKSNGFQPQQEDNDDEIPW